jgi:glycosyltransferase involved in cell wall biosynthesis
MKISIITICYNNLKDLQETCLSIDLQNESPFEHIVIDGSNNDEISNWLKTKPQQSYRTSISEKDHGIADAFNKGIKKSKGDIIQLLNSGDVFYNEKALGMVRMEFEKNNKTEWVHGKYEYYRSSNWIIIGKPFKENLLYRGMRSICHQTMFVKKEIYDKYGLYDTNISIAMDYDFICRISRTKAIFIDYPLIKMKPEGISNLNYIASLNEISKIYKKYKGHSFLHLLWKIRLKLIYYILKCDLGKILYNIKHKLGLENA